MASSISVAFECSSETAFGEKVVLVGAAPELGCWQIDGGLQLDTTPDTYPIWRSAQVTIEPPKHGQRIEYKYFLAGPKGTFWEAGENRALDWEDCKKFGGPQVVEDGDFRSPLSPKGKLMRSFSSTVLRRAAVAEIEPVTWGEALDQSEVMRLEGEIDLLREALQQARTLGEELKKERQEWKERELSSQDSMTQAFAKASEAPMAKREANLRAAIQGAYAAAAEFDAAVITKLKAIQNLRKAQSEAICQEVRYIEEALAGEGQITEIDPEAAIERALVLKQQVMTASRCRTACQEKHSDLEMQVQRIRGSLVSKPILVAGGGGGGAGAQRRTRPAALLSALVLALLLAFVLAALGERYMKGPQPRRLAEWREG